MANRGTTMALAACSLTAAPLFISPTKTSKTVTDSVKMTVQDRVESPALRGTVPNASTGTPQVVAAGVGVLALVAAGAGRQRQTLQRTVCAAAPEVEPYTPPPPPPFNPSKQVGAMAPLGFFDPLGFAKMGDEEGFNNLRAAEIKHGRVAMMAALGAVVQHLVKFPGFEKVPAGLSAVTSAPGTYGFIALLALGAGFELAIWKQDPAKEPGNFGNPVGWGSYDDDMRNKEINNGRFAMFAALGIIAADLVTGKDALQQLGA
jgi:light-harvesting complex I chlorophyll a/b binding protein 1